MSRLADLRARAEVAERQVHYVARAMMGGSVGHTPIIARAELVVMRNTLIALSAAGDADPRHDTWSLEEKTMYALEQYWAEVGRELE